MIINKNVAKAVLLTSTFYNALVSGITPALAASTNFSDSITMLNSSSDSSASENKNNNSNLNTSIQGVSDQKNEKIDGKNKSAGSPAAVDVETITVTGSRIRGKIAAGANVNTVTRDELEKSGYSTVQEFFNQLPQNFSGGGGSEDPSDGPLATSNLFSGSSVNLRGLGADATLILINGRRIAASGLEGNFFDISLIPQTAIQRIEILPDGASALYGSDAVGGVINFILRKDFSGAETRLRYGTATTGQLDEYRLAQAFGHHWQSGNVLLSYEYYKRDALKFGERDFASTFDQRARGGADRRLIHANPGNILSPMTFEPAYALPKNQDGRNLNVSDLLPNQVNKSDRLGDVDLLPRQSRHGLFIVVQQEITHNIEVFAEGRYSNRKFKQTGDPLTSTLVVPSQNPFFIDPFNVGFTLVNYSFETELGLPVTQGRVRSSALIAGVKTKLFEWHWETVASYNREKSTLDSDQLNHNNIRIALSDRNRNTALNVFGHNAANNPETISKIVTDMSERPISKVFDINSIADGDLFSIFDRQVSAAIGLNYRADKFKYRSLLGGVENRSDNLDRDVVAAFAELFIPIINDGDQIELIKNMELSIAGRIDDYGGAIGTTTNPRVGLRISPENGLTINATYAKSFRAPNLVETSTQSNRTALASLIDPQSPSGLTTTLVLAGNNPDIDNEKATTWSIGATIEPHAIPGLHLTATYFSTNFKDRIGQATTDLQTVLEQENLFSDIITRNPDSNLLNALCSDPGFRGDPLQCRPEFVQAIVDFRLRNIARSTVRGIDLMLDYIYSAEKYEVTLGSAATYLIDYTMQISRSQVAHDFVNTVDNPNDLRIRSYISLSAGAFNGTMNVNYADSYVNNRSQLQRTVKSFTTVDIYAAVRLSKQLRFDKEGPLIISFSAVNVFDKDPPFVDNFIGYDGSNADPLGRLLALELRLEW